MELTKFEHACFCVRIGDQSIIIDPGNITSDLEIPDDIAAIILTHKHADHTDLDQIEAILDNNPEAVVAGTADNLSSLELNNAITTKPGDELSFGAFELEFFGGRHAVIHDSYPSVENVGVMINDTIYYPGDSFAAPDRPVDTLLLPVSAPWMKISEAMDYLTKIKPRLAIPTHDAILSAAGQQIVDHILTETADGAGVIYQRLTSPINI